MEFDGIDPTPQGDDADWTTFNPNNLLNHLLMVWSIEYLDDVPTKFSQPNKKSDVIVVDVVDLSTGETGRKVWWRQAQVIRDLKGSIGRPNPKLVVMSLGVATKGNPPYVLLDARGDAQAVAAANAWAQANPGFVPSAAGRTINPAVSIPTQLPPESPLEVMAKAALQGQLNHAATMNQARPRPPANVASGVTWTPPLPPAQKADLPDEPPF